MFKKISMENVYHSINRNEYIREKVTENFKTLSSYEIYPKSWKDAILKENLPKLQLTISRNRKLNIETFNRDLDGL